MKFTDQEVLAAIRKGDDDPALAFLYKKHWPVIRRYVVKNNGTEEEAQDIFQDAIIAFYRHVKLNKFNDRYEIGAFIFSVGRNFWINKVKKDQKQAKLSEEVTHERWEENILHDIITEERAALVRKVFSKMGEKCRELLTYTIFHRYSMHEVCELMGFSTENAAKTRNYKCKQQLIKLVHEHDHLKRLLSA